MIVLENVGVARSCEINQRGSSRETHRHTEGELMGRGHVNYFGRALFRWSRDRDSFPVNRSWNNSRPGKAQGSAGLVKSRLLDPSHFTPIYERHHADHHCLLGSSGDDDLVWITARTSMITQIRCECLAQIGVATARCVLEQMCSFFCEDLHSQSLPYRDRKFVERCDSGNKGNTRRPSDSKIKLFSSSLIWNI